MRQIHVQADKNQQLRQERSSHRIESGAEHQRLSALEIQLGLCMGPLRQRRHDSTPAGAPARPRCALLPSVHAARDLRRVPSMAAVPV
ncbi:DUF2630 family protein [Streptomyces sp. NPDC093984]|uniref:DUF2630 family protein n=1 Tax=Streptomyces sp. NPDC093984 TaxID=3366052 RepID=UPI00380BA8F8